MTTEEWEAELGRHLRTLRLRQNIDQRSLAKQAGVALNAVKRLELGRGATVSSLVKVLRALGREGWLAALAPQVTVSPLQLLDTGRSERRRARRKTAV